MGDHYLTKVETILLFAIFVLPFLIAGAITQYFLLKRTSAKRWQVVVTVAMGIPISLIMWWPLMWILPSLSGLDYGNGLVLPALLATIIFTGVVWVISKRNVH